MAFAAPAAGQIYSWHDANGHLVLSDKPSAAVERTYTVPRADSVLATRPVAAERTRQFDEVITEHARLSSVRPDLVRAVVQVESGFNPYARSPKGAMGLMQLMPATIEQFGVLNPFNPIDNIRAGVRYLRLLLDRYQNDEQLALAAYNAGPGAVDRHGQRIPPYRETREYVKRISKIVSRPAQPKAAIIYKTTEVVDGREVPRYSDHKPESGRYEVVTAR